MNLSRLIKIVLGFTNDFKITISRRILALEQKTISLASSLYFEEVQHQAHNWVDESSLQSLNLDIELRQRYGRYCFDCIPVEGHAKILPLLKYEDKLGKPSDLFVTVNPTHSLGSNVDLASEMVTDLF